MKGKLYDDMPQTFRDRVQAIAVPHTAAILRPGGWLERVWHVLRSSDLVTGLFPSLGRLSTLANWRFDWNETFTFGSAKRAILNMEGNWDA